MSIRSAVGHTPEEFCLKCIESLEAHPTAPSKIVRDTGALDKLMESQNRDPWNILECSFPGKDVPTDGLYPKIVLEYDAPQCDEPAVACDLTDTVCTDGRTTDRIDNYLEMIIEDCVHDKITITVDEFDQLCESPNERWAQELQRMHTKMKRQKEFKVIERLYNLLSDYPSGNASTGATTGAIPIVTSDGRINNSGFAKIMATYRNAFYSGPLQYIGGAVMQSYFDINMLKSGANAERMDSALNVPFAYSSQIDPVFQNLEGDTDSHFITFPTGHVSVIDVNENTGYRRFNMDQYFADTLTIDGTEYDYWVRFTECPSPQWTIMLRNRFCVPMIPDSAYCVAGLLYHWEAICGDWDCSVLDAA